MRFNEGVYDLTIVHPEESNIKYTHTSYRAKDAKALQDWAKTVLVNVEGQTETLDARACYALNSRRQTLFRHRCWSRLSKCHNHCTTVYGLCVRWSVFEITKQHIKAINRSH